MHLIRFWRCLLIRVPYSAILHRSRKPQSHLQTTNGLLLHLVDRPPPPPRTVLRRSLLVCKLVPDHA
jgi:hypothetical protein